MKIFLLALWSSSNQSKRLYITLHIYNCLAHLPVTFWVWYTITSRPTCLLWWTDRLSSLSDRMTQYCTVYVVGCHCWSIVTNKQHHATIDHMAYSFFHFIFIRIFYCMLFNIDLFFYVCPVHIYPWCDVLFLKLCLYSNVDIYGI